MNRYEEYIEAHAEEIAQLVNQDFENNKDELKIKVLHIIWGYIHPVPPHYIWVSNGCPYDISGELKKAGMVDLNQTIAEFLEHEYNGNSSATYVSGCGLNWDTYGDRLGFETLNLGGEILQKRTEECLKSAFPDITNEEIEYAFNEKLDNVYDLSYASDFFFYEKVIEFLGIGDTLLKNLR